MFADNLCQKPWKQAVLDPMTLESNGLPSDFFFFPSNWYKANMYFPGIFPIKKITENNKNRTRKNRILIYAVYVTTVYEIRDGTMKLNYGESLN